MRIITKPGTRESTVCLEQVGEKVKLIINDIHVADITDDSIIIEVSDVKKAGLDYISF